MRVGVDVRRLDQSAHSPECYYAMHGSFATPKGRNCHMGGVIPVGRVDSLGGLRLYSWFMVAFPPSLPCVQSTFSDFSIFMWGAIV